MKGISLNTDVSSIQEGKDYLRNRLERLFFIPEGETLGYPDWGSKLQQIFHEPEDETTADEIINEITFLIQEREPDIEIEDIYVEILGLDAGSTGVIIKLNVYTIDSEEPQEIEFFKIHQVLL